MSFEFPIVVTAVKLIAVMARIGAFVFAFPIFNNDKIPNKYKLAFVFMFSVILLPVLPEKWGNNVFLQNMDLLKLVVLILSEVLLGLCVALFVMMIVDIFAFAGSIIDRDVGFMMAKIFDPATNTQKSLISQVFVQLFVISLLIMDGHHELLRLAAFSFKTLPPGSFYIDGPLKDIAIQLGSQMLSLGFRIALPIFSIVFFINVGMGLMTRVGQDFPVLMLSFPIKLGVGLLMIMSMFPIVIIICRNVQSQMFDWLSFVIRM